MIQKDYIERLVQDILTVLAKLAGMKDMRTALNYVDEAYDEYLNLDKNYLDRLSPENIVEKLTEEKNLNIHQMELLAEIMAKEGEYLFNLERPNESMDRLNKALAMFNYIAEEGKLYSLERQLTIQKTNQLLTDIKLNQ